jgi:hypothetical protein
MIWVKPKFRQSLLLLVSADFTDQWDILKSQAWQIGVPLRSEKRGL